MGACGFRPHTRRPNCGARYKCCGPSNCFYLVATAATCEVAGCDMRKFTWACSSASKPQDHTAPVRCCCLCKALTCLLGRYNPRAYAPLFPTPTRPVRAGCQHACAWSCWDRRRARRARCETAQSAAASAPLGDHPGHPARRAGHTAIARWGCRIIANRGAVGGYYSSILTKS